MIGVDRRAGVAAFVAAAGALAAGEARADSAPSVSEVVVTAERTNRVLSQVAASVAVTTGEEADDTAGAYGTNDIVARQVNVVAVRPSSTLPVIRGVDGTGPAVGGNAFFAGTRARVNYVVDGRSLTYNEAVYLDAGIWDAQQVEVYRGLVHRYAAPADGNALIDGREYSADVRLKLGRPGGTLSGFIAGYLYDADQSEEIDIFDGAFKDSTQTRAVFGEATWRPVEKLDLTLGARYEEEERNRTGATSPAVPITIDFHETFAAFLPRATVLYHATKDLTVGATVGKGYNAGGVGISFEDPYPSEIYGKETVWNYELFLRGRLFDPRLQVSANIFYNDYKGLQLPFDVNPDPAISALVIRNADRATTYGAELEARFHWLPHLETYAQLGLLKTRVDEYDDPTVQGNDLLRSPAMTLAAGVVYAPRRGLGASFDVRYTDAYYSDAFNDPRGKTDPYAIANAQVSYRFPKARLFAAVTNIFDETAVQGLSPGTTFAEDVATVAAPRRWSAGLEVSF